MSSKICVLSSGSEVKFQEDECSMPKYKLLLDIYFGFIYIASTFVLATHILLQLPVDTDFLLPFNDLAFKALSLTK